MPTQQIFPRILRALAPLGAVVLLAVATPARAADDGTVRIITGMEGGTDIAAAADLMMFDDLQAPIRVLPMLGKGALQNLVDIVHLRGVDIGMVQVDVLTYAKSHNLLSAPDLAKIQYIAKLYDDEIHLIARPGINSIEDLADKKVNVDIEESGSALTAEVIFNALGVNANLQHMPQINGLQALRDGTIDAVFQVGGAPVPKLAELTGEGLHFVPVPLAGDLAKVYIPAQLTRDEYPNLIPAGTDPVSTLAIGDVMAVYAWPQDAERYKQIARFIDAFFSRFPDLQKPPHHPKWQSVNLAAVVPGWGRFPAVQGYMAALEDRKKLMALARQIDFTKITRDQEKQLFANMQAVLREQIQLRAQLP